MRLLRTLALLVFGVTMNSAAEAYECRETRFDGIGYTLCTVDARQDQLRLFLWDRDDYVYGHFSKIDKALAAEGLKLPFAMNAGMYHEDREPVGYYLENGQEFQRVISRAGPGNFGLVPNGIFCLRGDRYDVFETKDFLRRAPSCHSATQSGPMLVIDGKLHPKFLRDSTSRYIRNGVGTSADGQKVVFAISNEVVTFHEFGRLFRDHLKLPNALYFDGNVSRLRARDIGRDDVGLSSLGPIIGVVEPG